MKPLLHENRRSNTAQSNGFEAYFNDKKVRREDIDTPFYFVKRFEYDEFLHDQAVNAGADVHLGDGVRSININDMTVETEEGEVFHGRYIIGADGATSRIRHELSNKGLVDTEDWQHNLAIGAEAYVPRDAVNLDVNYPMLHFGVLNWGYGWIFPNTDRLLIGVGGLNRKNEKGFRQILDEYLDVVGVEYDPDVVKGHPIPFGNYLNYPAYENILLIGDAAGTVDAITGEGIFYAQRSGELAAHAILNSENKEAETPANNYVKALEEHVHPEMKHSKRVRLFIWGGPQYPRYLAMKAWFSLFSDTTAELVHGIRVYKYLKKNGTDMHESLPQMFAR